MSELEEKLALLKQKHDGDIFNADNVQTLVEGIEYAMSHGGDISVAVTPVENGYKITVTDSEGYVQEATVQNGGDAYAVYVSTVPQGQTPMSKAEWLASLKGATGDNGHNPCVGRFTSYSSLPTTGVQNGDYAYVDTVSNGEVTSTKVYHYTTEWEAETDGVEVTGTNTAFNSGQDIADTPIKDLNGNTDQTAEGVLSAEAGKELNEKIEGFTSYNYVAQTLTPDMYYNTNYDPMSGSAASSVSGTYCVGLTVLAGQRYRIKGIGGNKYALLYATTDSSFNQIRKSNTDENYRNTPLILEIQEGEAKLFVNLYSYQEGDGVELIEETITPGIKQQLESIENDIERIDSNLAAIDEHCDNIEEATRQNTEDINGLSNIVDTDLVAGTILPGGAGYPARNDGSYSNSDYFMRYVVDLEGKYALGYRKVRFYGCQFSSTSTITAGLIATDIINNVATVESYVPYDAASPTYFETELPITENSKYLVMTGLTEKGHTRPAYADIPDLTSVTFLAGEESKGLKERVEDLEQNPVLQGIDVDLPDVIYAVVGDTLQLYYKSIFRCVDPYIYDIKVTCNIGAQYPRYYELTPTTSNIGERPITFTIKDNNNNVLGEKMVTLKVVSKANNHGTKNILCVGASNTSGGQWPAELKKRLTTASGTPTVSNGQTLFTPIGFSIPNLNFVGRKTANGVNLEATGGYNFTTYITASVAYVRFFFTQENAPTVSIGDTYTDGTTVFTVAEINVPDLNQLQGYYGNINFSVVSLPVSVGLTLTRVSGSGDASITASDSSMSGNPFVYDGVINIGQYAEDYCDGQIDIIYTELFGNGLVNQYQTDFSQTFAKMQSFIDMFLDEFPSCKFCINIMQNKDEKGGLGENYYASTSAYAYPFGMKFGCHNLLPALQKYIKDNNLENTVFIVNTLNEFDCENNYRQTQKQVNPRSGVTEIFGVNGAHPSNIGYYQMADAAVRTFIAHFCQ